MSDMREVLRGYTEWLADQGALILGSETSVEGLVVGWLGRPSLREQVARNIREDVPPAFRSPDERPQTIWKQQGQAEQVEEDVMSAAAQELLRIVRGEVKANRYADDDSPVAPSFDERIRAAECLLGNRTELDIKGLDAFAHRVAGSTGPR